MGSLGTKLTIKAEQACTSTVSVPDIGGWLDSLLVILETKGIEPFDVEEVRSRLKDTSFDAILSALDRAGPDLDGSAGIALYQHWIEATNSSSQLLHAAWFNLGVLFAHKGDHANAANAYGSALALRPDMHCAAINLGLLLETSGQPEQALAIWKSAEQPDSARVALEIQQGRLLEKLGRFEEAESVLRRVLMTDCGQPDVLHHWMHIRQKICQWPVTPSDIPGVSAKELVRSSGPLGILALTDDIDLQRDAAAAWIARKTEPAPRRLAPMKPYAHERIRVGYMSSDFCSHAMSYLITELFERHDRRRFEVFGYCSSLDDGSQLRMRVLGAFDHYRIIRTLSDEQAAQVIRDDEIDVLIELNGITDGSRLPVLRWRPAPVQATYLGFIGPVPLPELDYLLCDNMVIPPEHEAAYQPAPLPVGPIYQANDTKRTTGNPLSRKDAGLPEDRFVLCCFSKHYKITEDMFACWMSILLQASGAVLWLTTDNEYSRANMLAAARRAGIAEERLIFAERTDPDIYLSRLALADLFLDTFPYNAGTVASDAIRMRVPLVTLCGKAFASRMAASLLHAMSAPQGITTSLSNYIDTAVRLANDPAAHARYKALFTQQAWSRTIGNIERFTIEFEATLSSLIDRASTSSMPPDAHAFDPTNSQAALAAGAEKTGLNSIRTSPTGFAELDLDPPAGSVGIGSNSASRASFEAEARVQPCSTLLIEGWRGLSHSYGLINQYQILELLKIKGLQLFHDDLPFFNKHWNRTDNDAGFPLAAQKKIDALAPAGSAHVDCVYRISSPIAAGADNDHRRTLTFMITELGLTESNIAAEPSRHGFFVREDNLIVTPTRWSRDRIVEFGFPAEKVRIVPLGVDTAIFSPLTAAERVKNRAALGIRENETVFVNVGGAFWNKGIDLLLRAFATLRDQGCQVRLIVKDQRSLYGVPVEQAIQDVGKDYPSLLHPDTLAAISVIRGNLGRPELRALYSIADCYVSPYRAEGFNLPVLEAIACGTPVIVTHGGATDDFCPEGLACKIPGQFRSTEGLAPGGAGRYVEPNFDALIGAMEQFASGRRLDETGLSKAREQVLRDFSWDHAARELARLVNEGAKAVAPIVLPETRTKAILQQSRESSREDVLDLIRMMRPRSMLNTSKVRIGNDYDGGYVLPATALSCDAVLSIGVGLDVSFDLHLAERGATVFQFDNTVDQSPMPHRGFIFYKRGWGTRSEGSFLDFADICAKLLPLAPKRPLLKFDIEGAEYDVFETLDPSTLARFEVITCEMHDLHRLSDKEFFDRACLFLRKLTLHHAPVHLHVNNYRPMATIWGLRIPQVLEISLLRRDLDSIHGFSSDPIPGTLDRPNHPFEPDVEWPELATASA